MIDHAYLSGQSRTRIKCGRPFFRPETKIILGSIALTLLIVFGSAWL